MYLCARKRVCVRVWRRMLGHSENTLRSGNGTVVLQRLLGI
jgi:hypothetical protein